MSEGLKSELNTAHLIEQKKVESLIALKSLQFSLQKVEAMIAFWSLLSADSITHCDWYQQKEPASDWLHWSSSTIVSQVAANSQLALTCDSVWPALAWTYVDLVSLWTQVNPSVSPKWPPIQVNAS